MNSISQLQLSTNNLLNWVLQNKDKSHFLPSYTLEIFRNQIFEYYQFLFLEVQDLNLSSKKIKSFIDEDYKDHATILEIKDLVDENKKFLKYFLLQGSYGDLKLSGAWSDFDAIAVVNQKSLTQENFYDFLFYCRSIDNEMRKIDPYQHHGIQFIHEYEFFNYPNLYYPIELYEETKCLLGNKDILYKQVSSKDQEVKRVYSIINTLISASEIGELRHHAKDGVYLLENYENNAMYQIKYFLCVLMLLPTLWLNAIGVYCSKRESFSLIRKYFEEEELEIIEKASKIRTLWQPLDEESVKNNVIPDIIKKVLGKNYLLRGGQLAKRFKKELDTRLQ